MSCFVFSCGCWWGRVFSHRVGFSTSTVRCTSVMNNDFYCVRWLDKENVQHLRQQTLQAHLEYMEKIQCVSLGGPLFNKHNIEIGRLLLLQGVDRAQVERYMQQDPFQNILSSMNLTIFKRIKDFPVSWPETLFVVYCLDDPDKKQQNIRMEYRPQHRSWWQQDPRVVTVGPMASVDDPSSLVRNVLEISLNGNE